MTSQPLCLRYCAGAQPTIFAWSFLMFLYLCLPDMGYAQSGWCDSQPETNYMQVREHLSALRTTDNSPIKIALSMYAFSASEEPDSVTPEAIQEAVAYMNEVFADAHISFFILGDIHYVQSDRLYYFDMEENSNDQNEVDRFYAIDGAVNVYFIGSVQIGNSFPFNWCGRSYFPDNGIDKILIKNTCTSGPLLAHEMGHLLSLLHTHDTAYGEELVDGSNCDIAGDLLCDTPADPGSLNNRVDDNCIYTAHIKDANGDEYTPDVQNLMSYAPDKCRTTFSPQQLSQMNQAYYTYKTHLIDHPYLALFSTNDTTICEEQSATFSDASIGAVQYEWTFKGGTPASSTQANPTVVYNEEGLFDVSLTITDKDGNTDTKTRQNCIEVKTPETAVSTSLSGSFEENEMTETVLNPDASVTFEITDVAATSGDHSARINFFNYEYAEGEQDYLVLGQVNNALQPSCAIFLDYAYASYSEFFYDGLAIVYREPCGEWQTLWEKYGEDLQTADPSTYAFVPEASQWKQLAIPLDLPASTATYEIALKAINGWGNALYIDNYYVSATPVPPVISRKGNRLSIEAAPTYNIQWWYNDTPIEQDTSSIVIETPGTYMATVDNGICSDSSEPYDVDQVLGIDQNTTDDITIYPNPASSDLHLYLPEALLLQAQEIHIWNCHGQLQYHSRFTSDIPLRNWKAGIYILEITGSGFAAQKVFVKQYP